MLRFLRDFNVLKSRVIFQELTSLKRFPNTLDRETHFMQHIIDLVFHEIFYDNHRSQAQYYSIQLRKFVCLCFINSPTYFNLSRNVGTFICSLIHSIRFQHLLCAKIVLSVANKSVNKYVNNKISLLIKLILVPGRDNKVNI